MLLQLIVLELILLMVAGANILWGAKGILAGLIIVSAINCYYNCLLENEFLFWQIIITLYVLIGLFLNYYLNKKTDQLRLVKVVTGSAVSGLAWSIFLPLIPGLLIWAFLIGIPLVFTYRKIPLFFYVQLFFKFIFSTGWLIIGNIL